VRDEDRVRRSKWLWVRVTSEEAAHVAYVAGARGLTVSDFVRVAVLRGLSGRSLVGRRALPTDAANAVRQLSAIAVNLRRLVGIAQANGAIRHAELDACITEARAAIAVFDS